MKISQNYENEIFLRHPRLKTLDRIQSRTDNKRQETVVRKQETGDEIQEAEVELTVEFLSYTILRKFQAQGNSLSAKKYSLFSEAGFSMRKPVLYVSYLPKQHKACATKRKC